MLNIYSIPNDLQLYLSLSSSLRGLLCRALTYCVEEAKRQLPLDTLSYSDLSFIRSKSISDRAVAMRVLLPDSLLRQSCGGAPALEQLVPDYVATAAAIVVSVGCAGAHMLYPERQKAVARSRSKSPSAHCG